MDCSSKRPASRMTPASTQRKRVSQACDRCRSRKDKCDGVKPICSTCAIGGHNCSYDPSIKKRGLPEGYVRGLENLWGLTIREAPDVETTILSLLDQNKGIEVLSRAWSDKDCEETLLETWRGSRLSKKLDTLLPLLELADDKTAKRKRQESSLPGPAYNSIPLLPRGDTGERIESRPTKYVASAPEESKYEVSPVTVTSLLELPRNTWDLIDLYFSYIHSWLPILEKHNLLKAAHSYPASVSSGIGSGDHALLWAVLALSKGQQNGLRPNSRLSNQQQKQPGAWRPSAFYVTARKFIPDEDGEFELGHVQALLLLALLNMGQDRYKQAWLLSGTATRVAVELGLGSSEDARSRNRHAYLGCFVLDTIIAARLKREPHLRTQTVLKHGLLLEDGSDEWDPWTDHTNGRQPMHSANARVPGKVLSSFNLLVELVGVLNTAMLDHCIQQEGFSNYRRVLLNLATPTNFHDRLAVIPPQQYHNELLFSSLSSLFGMQKQGHSPPRLTVPELLGLWRETYGLGTTPPTVDCFASLHLRRFDYLEGATLDVSLPALGEYLSDMAQTWPTFNRSLAELQKYQSMGFGPKHAPSQPRASRASIPAPSGDYGNSSQREHSQSVDGSFATPPNSTAYTPSGQAILEAAIQFDPSLLTDTTNTQQRQTTTSPWGVPLSPGLNQGAKVLGRRSDVSPNTQPQPFYPPPFPSPVDEDSVFNEFAALDTMKW